MFEADGDVLHVNGRTLALTISLIQSIGSYDWFYACTLPVAVAAVIEVSP